MSGSKDGILMRVADGWSVIRTPPSPKLRAVPRAYAVAIVTHSRGCGPEARSQLRGDVVTPAARNWASSQCAPAEGGSPEMEGMAKSPLSCTMNASVDFLFSTNTQWPPYAPAVLVPYAARIETLDVPCAYRAQITRNLDISLSAPQLRVLDLSHLNPMDLLLVPSLEDTMPPRIARRSAFRPVVRALPDDYDFRDFARHPLAPAIGFSDVVLETLSASLYNNHPEDEFARALRALLYDVGPLLVLESFASPEIELRDGAGHTRRLQCWNEDSSFDVQDVWEHLSQHYDLYKTEEYIESFATYPPQAPDGIALALSGGSDPFEDCAPTPQIMRIGGLAKVEFHRARSYDVVTLEAIVEALARIETPGTCAVEV
ncbi:hypothetical protein DFH09DRAFT_1301120 [Mycena vulgaris]|nr:hypothetical protein DFH09DRAFT_1301120 [Mycena vulgaris]